MNEITRRTLLKYSGVSAAMLSYSLRDSAASVPGTERQMIRVSLNENAYGPSATVVPALTREFTCLSRYATEAQANDFIEQIATHERVAPEQVILGEILEALGLHLGSQNGPGGEFLYSVPGYLALIDAASHVGGIGVPVPLNKAFENDLPALEEKLSTRTRAVYLVNPHNPTGTSNEPITFHRFLKEASQRAPIIVDEAYIEYTSDAPTRSAVSLVRDGADVLVFRTFAKIHGLAGVPIGYTVGPTKFMKLLRGAGLGDVESLGRLNIAAASAALGDQHHVFTVRDTVAQEREKWLAVLEELNLPHTRARASFVFFDTGHPQINLMRRLREHGIEIARAFPPFSSWARITIGLPEENRRVQSALRDAVQSQQTGHL